MGMLGRALWRHGETVRAREVAAAGVALLEADRDEDLVLAYSRVAALDAMAGRAERALEWAQKAIDLAGEIGFGNIVRAQGMRGLARLDLGDAGGVEDLRTAADLALALNLPAEDTAIALGNLAEVLGDTEGVASGRAQTEASLEFARSRGHVHHVMYSRMNLLWSLFHEGRWDELLAEADEVIEWDRERGGTQLELWTLSDLAVVLTHRGQASRAAELVSAVLPRAREVGDQQTVLPLLVAAALAARARGDLETAQEMVGEYAATWSGARVGRNEHRVWLALVAPAVDRVDGGERLLVGDEAWTALGRHSRAHARALLAEASGRRDEAALLFAEAADGWKTWGSVPLRAYALVGLGTCADDAAALEAGREIFAALGAEPVGASTELRRQQHV
jgi:tetratricopeptide (TPR) repeat protein